MEKNNLESPNIQSATCKAYQEAFVYNAVFRFSRNFFLWAATPVLIAEILYPRVLDMSHCLILQAKDKPRRAFGIVKERIVTTQPCSVIEEVQQGEQCGGGLSLCGPTKPNVRYQDLRLCYPATYVANRLLLRGIFMSKQWELFNSAGFPERQRKFTEGL